ncbi:hypothetical protein PPYR_05376 [Photinus pyralis]|uniref:Uncharacterized protein n=1 Tax=Photinus pyralis TaxID=7054 RepID=A0A1Y1NED5_PHOPY|nr:uncharacterized protein LOC116165957 isoform X2 [Photinus pyralis]KAB0801022.1 hypothetical protein PPYR_05376 [Photinus pyralis]
MNKMAAMIVKLLLLLSISILKANSQENAANSIAPGLRECYNNMNYFDREKRLPSSINVLIALIRKIEKAPYIQNDRELSMQLIQRFKQDGIVAFDVPTDSEYGIPASPMGFQAAKNKVILRKIIPGIAENFPNSSLSEIERCSLHFMLSNTIHVKPRGDEQQVCKKLGRFQRRVPRTAEPDRDIEMFDPKHHSDRTGNLQENNEPVDPSKDIDIDVQRDLAKKTLTFELSDCPVEDGVVYTRWGAVQAGHVISGIAAARDQQYIIKDGVKVDGRYAATLAGDLAEVVLHQGVKSVKQFEVGVKGGWNGTQVPRWYFIEKNFNLELTDAEIRGGLDGLILAKNIDSWRDKFRTLKISQILDMFYSQRGIFSSKYRACNRKGMYYEVAPKDELVTQTFGFGLILEEETTLFGTINDKGIQKYSEDSVNALNDYISSIQDLKCEIDNDVNVRAAADVLLVLDTQWEFKLIESVIAYLLDSVNINPYGGNYTIINAKTGEMMVNSSNTILDFYLSYNRTIHTNAPIGLDVPIAFDAVQKIFQSKINNETSDKYNRGKSSIAIFLPYSVLSEGDKSVASSKKEHFKLYLPDVKILALGRNGRDAFGHLVFDPSIDAFDLSDTSTDGTSIVQSTNLLVSRVNEIHRRISNPKCGADFSGEEASDSFDQYVEPNTSSYYKISPNYFFGDGERFIKFQGYGYGNLMVCLSRQDGKPRQNVTGGDTKCETMTGMNPITFSLTDACIDYDTVFSCPPLYISVQSNIADTETRSMKCIDSGCRYPDDIKYTIHVEKLSCVNGSFRFIGNLGLVTITILTFISSW